MITAIQAREMAEMPDHLTKAGAQSWLRFLFEKYDV